MPRYQGRFDALHDELNKAYESGRKVGRLEVEREIVRRVTASSVSDDAVRAVLLGPQAAAPKPTPPARRESVVVTTRSVPPKPKPKRVKAPEPSPIVTWVNGR